MGMLTLNKIRSAWWKAPPQPSTNGRTSNHSKTVIYLIFLLLLCFILCSILLTPFTYEKNSLDHIVIILGVMWMLGQVIRIISMEILADLLEWVSLYFAMALVLPITCALLGATALPFADSSLMTADRLLFGFDWITMMKAIEPHPKVLVFFSSIYSTISWQPLLLALIFMLTSQKEAWNLLSSWYLALLLCVILFPFFPALGAFAYHGIHPSDVPYIQVLTAWDAERILVPIRHGTARIIGPDMMGGIIAFPSFHASAATILGWYGSRHRILSCVFVPLNVLMLASALIIGGHYMIDVVGGLLVAVISIATATALHWGTLAPSARIWSFTTPPAVPAGEAAGRSV